MERRIMIIDDDRSICDLLTELFHVLGHEAIAFTDGCSALATMALESGRSRLDVVLLDLNMPGMNGMAVLRQMSTQHPGVPVIMMSATLDQEIFREAIAQGAMDWIGKPIDVEVLKYKLAKVFRA
jgi:DNA-binding NtrC family response regulator